MNFGGGFDGGASQFAGTGFMPTQSGADGGAGPAKRGGQTNTTLRAVTVKQLCDGLKDSQDDDFRIDGAELHNVALVGKVVSVQDRTSMTIVHVHDGTGQVEVRVWHNDDQSDQGQQQTEYRVGQYVRVYGHIRNFDKQKSLVSYSLRAIEDFNEVTYHFMQAIFQHLHLTKGAPPSNAQGGAAPAGGAWGGAAAAGGFNSGGYGAAPTYGAPSGGYGAVGMGGAPAGGAAPGAPKTLSDRVLDVFNQNVDRPDGLHVNEVASMVGASVPEVQAAADFLSTEGHLYTTVNDQTYKSTAAH